MHEHVWAHSVLVIIRTAFYLRLFFEAYVGIQNKVTMKLTCHPLVQPCAHPNYPFGCLEVLLVIIHQCKNLYLSICVMFCSQDMKAYSCLRHSPPPVSQLLLLLLSSPSWHTLHQSDNVISRKSEILLMSDVCISHSIPFFPQHQPFLFLHLLLYPTWHI